MFGGLRFSLIPPFGTVHWCNKVIQIRHYTSQHNNYSNLDKNIIVLSSTEFSKPTIDALLQHKHTTNSSPLTVNRLSLLCPADVRRGRGNKITPLAIKSYCIQHKLPVYDVPSDTNWSMSNYTLPTDIVQQYNIAIVIAFGYKISKTILNAFDLVLNIHPSLLPLYRGAAPIQHTLLNNDTVTGVSIIQLNEQIDSGHIIQQSEYNIEHNDTYSTLHDKLSKMGSNTLIDILSNVQHSMQQIKPQADYIAQLGDLYSEQRLRAPKLQKTIGAIDVYSMTAPHIYTIYRACHGFVPVYTFYHNKRVLITEMQPPVQCTDNNTQIGTITFDEQSHYILVKCVDNHSIAVSKVHVEYAKAPIPAKQFYDNIMTDTQLHLDKIH